MIPSFLITAGLGFLTGFSNIRQHQERKEYDREQYLINRQNIYTQQSNNFLSKLASEGSYRATQKAINYQVQSLRNRQSQDISRTARASALFQNICDNSLSAMRINQQAEQQRLASNIIDSNVLLTDSSAALLKANAIRAEKDTRLTMLQMLKNKPERQINDDEIQNQVDALHAQDDAREEQYALKAIQFDEVDLSLQKESGRLLRSAGKRESARTRQLWTGLASSVMNLL